MPSGRWTILHRHEAAFLAYAEETYSVAAGDRTGLSTALLSKLETDRMIPTLPTLATISRVYGVAMSYFFTEPAMHTLSITRKAHLQGNGRGVESVKSIPLHVLSEGTRLKARMIEFSAAALLAQGNPATKPADWRMCWKDGCRLMPAE